MAHYCPHCGAESKLLFNLLNCSTLKCRNYDAAWAKEWQTNNGPIFTNIAFHSSSDFHFLARYKSTGGTNFDLHTCKGELAAGMAGTGAEVDLCVARFGNLVEQAYYVDAAETEVGIVGQGATHNVSKDVQAALKQALTIYRKRAKFLAKKP
jgi:hypothetical protein